MLFTAPFMKKYGLKPFPIDPKTMDITEGQFIEELMDSLKAGYDSTKPILIAKCEDDDRIDGYVIDGRHRCYCLAKLKERGIPLPNHFPISMIDVRDVNHLRALIAQYEERNRSKGGRFAKAWIQENLKAIVDENIEVQGADKIGDFIKSLGFTNTAIISGIVDDYMGAPKPADKQKKKVRQVVGLPESVKGAWDSSPGSVLAGKEERFDIQYSYHSCPDCKTLLKITADLHGTVVKVKQAPTIKE